MAFADYFERNAQAASSLIRGFDATELRAILERETIGVSFDRHAARSSEGQAGLDLAIRLLARFYPTLVLHAQDHDASAMRSGLKHLAKQINPRVTVSSNAKNATRWLVFGKSALPTVAHTAQDIWYVGSDNWLAKLSTAGPLGSGRTKNPFGVGVATCVAVANLFRAIFSSQLGHPDRDDDLCFSVHSLERAKSKDLGPRLTKAARGEVCLVGAGAVGNGFIWAASRAPLTGKLNVIDPELLEDSNLQRYVMTRSKDSNQTKAGLAERWVSSGKNTALRVVPHNVSWSAYFDHLEDKRIAAVVSAVDSAAVRIETQASLPRRIFNGWTQAGEAGVSRHDFLGDMACLACLYLPKGKAPNEDQLVLRALRLPESALLEVRRRLQQHQPTELGFLEFISEHSEVSLAMLRAYEGMPLREMYFDAVCGGKVMEFQAEAREMRTDVPMAFQSALTGILLAADLILDRSSTKTITQIDLLRPFPDVTSHPRRKSQSAACICADADFQEVYRKKYE